MESLTGKSSWEECRLRLRQKWEYERETRTALASVYPLIEEVEKYRPLKQYERKALGLYLLNRNDSVEKVIFEKYIGALWDSLHTQA